MFLVSLGKADTSILSGQNEGSYWVHSQHLLLLESTFKPTDRESLIGSLSVIERLKSIKNQRKEKK